MKIKTHIAKYYYATPQYINNKESKEKCIACISYRPDLNEYVLTSFVSLKEKTIEFLQQQLKDANSIIKSKKK